MDTLTQKLTGLYVAYAPEFRVSACGGCRDEAINNLTDEIYQLHVAQKATGEERKTNALV